MPEHIISSQWICECSTSNPLRKRNCIACGLKMPNDFLDKVYKEEISAQNIFFRRIKYEKESSYCKKVGGVLNKMQAVAVVFFIVAFSLCSVTRFYFYPKAISVYTNNYIGNREARFTDELSELTQEFVNLRKVSNVTGQLSNNIWDSVEDIEAGFSKDRKRNLINNKKINHIEERIMEVKNYVAGKLR